MAGVTRRRSVNLRGEGPGGGPNPRRHSTRSGGRSARTPSRGWASEPDGVPARRGCGWWGKRHGGSGRQAVGRLRWRGSEYHHWLLSGERRGVPGTAAGSTSGRGKGRVRPFLSAPPFLHFVVRWGGDGPGAPAEEARTGPAPVLWGTEGGGQLGVGLWVHPGRQDREKDVALCVYCLPELLSFLCFSFLSRSALLRASSGSPVDLFELSVCFIFSPALAHASPSPRFFSACCPYHALAQGVGRGPRRGIGEGSGRGRGEERTEQRGTLPHRHCHPHPPKKALGGGPEGALANLLDTLILSATYWPGAAKCIATIALCISSPACVTHRTYRWMRT